MNIEGPIQFVLIYKLSGVGIWAFACTHLLKQGLIRLGAECPHIPRDEVAQIILK